MKLGLLHPHDCRRISYPELCIVEKADSQRDGLLLEIHNERLSAERPVIARVELDLGLALIILLDDTKLSKALHKLIYLRIVGQPCHEHGRVLRPWGRLIILAAFGGLP